MSSDAWEFVTIVLLMVLYGLLEARAEANWVNGNEVCDEKN